LDARACAAECAHAGERLPARFVAPFFSTKGIKEMSDDVVCCSVSLFSGGGVGDIGVHYGAQVPVIACSEVVPERAQMLRTFFPQATVHEGDIWVEKETIISSVQARLNGRRPFLLVMSPPCQGMSSNGAGRITAAVTKGTRPKEDRRNRLVLPALDIADALQPDVVLLENVKHMLRTTIQNEFDETENAIDVVRRRLGAYRFEWKVVNASSYGVPQRRERLICIATRDARRADVPLHCPPTHPTPITLWQAIGHLSALDALSKCKDEVDPFHHVPAWTVHQHFCMRHTPEGHTAFDNLACISCEHLNAKDAATCAQCRQRLARPSMVKRTASCSACYAPVAGRLVACPACGGTSVVKTDETRLVRAFRTAYKRMEGGRPASTLTTNSGVISSDVKGHPYQHRVLSVREVLICASLSSFPGFEAPWHAVVEDAFANVSPRTIREISGESIPSLVLSTLVRHVLVHRLDKLFPLP
tara:strand:- start:2240 stop:3661 length:1422 start_codon:yes stop_codon:yes gene_type:complete